MLIGIILFSMQTLSTSEVAQPHKILGWLLVEDRADYNRAVQRQEQAEAVEGTAEPPDVLIQYRDEPAQGFRERFDDFAAGLESPEGLVVVPVQLSEVQGLNIVEAGNLPPEESDSRALSYFLVRMKPDDIRVLLRLLLGRDFQVDEKYFIGPYQFTAAEGPQELILPEGNRVALTSLPDEASAMQGQIFTAVEEIEPNAMMLLPTGDTEVGDFARATNTLRRDLAASTQALRNSGIEPDIVPLVQFSDFRHNPMVFAFAAMGEALFMAGGFLLLFHFIAKIAAKERREKSYVINNFINTCRLVQTEGKLYAITVGLFLTFWLWGTVGSYLDPGGQAGMVQWIVSQFAGSSWPLGFAGQAYASGNVAIAAFATFLVNFVQGTFLALTVFSVIPVAWGFIINAIRGQIIGLVLAPTQLFSGQMLTPHLLTIVLELQGYLIAGFASVLLPLALIKPKRFGVDSRWAAFKRFALWQFKVLPLIAAVLAVSAVYEAVEILVLAYFF
jgi:hypothetical protein